MKADRLTSVELPPDIKQRMNSSSFLGSPDFARVFKTMGGSDVYWVVNDGGSPVMALTSVEFGHRPMKRLQCMPDGLYTGFVPLSNLGDSEAECYRSVAQAMAGAGYARCVVADFYRRLEMPPEWEEIECQTTMVDISGNDWQPPDKKIRSEIRKAEREGIIVEAFDPDKHFESFVTLMESTEKRHGRKPKYSADFFLELAHLAQVDNRVQWMHVEVQGRAAASHINFVENDMIVNWQIYFDKEFSWLKPNQYLLFETCRRMAGRGVRWLNLGASPPDAESLSAQKNKWGGEQYAYKCYTLKTGLGHVL